MTNEQSPMTNKVQMTNDEWERGSPSRSACEPRNASIQAGYLCVTDALRLGEPRSYWSLVITLGLLILATAALSAPPEPARKDPIVVDEKTEPIIKGALKYLASKQS